MGVNEEARMIVRINEVVSQGKREGDGESNGK